MINCSTYFFGMVLKDYFQYPLDSLQTRLVTIANHFEAESQIVTYREQNLMYYTYMRKVGPSADSHSYFGICLLINGMATYNFTSLFRVFESTIQNMALEGKVLSVGNDGAIQIIDAKRKSLHNELCRVSDLLKALISEGERFFTEMPPVNYSTSMDDWHVATLNDGEWAIRSMMEQYNTLYVVKNRGLNNSAFNGLALKIERLNDELELQRAMNLELEKKISKYKSEKTFASIGKILLSTFLAVTIIIVYMIKNQLVQFNF